MGELKEIWVSDWRFRNGMWYADRPKGTRHGPPRRFVSESEVERLEATLERVRERVVRELNGSDELEALFGDKIPQWYRDFLNDLHAILGGGDDA